MALIEQDIVVSTRHGRMPGFCAAPADGGPHPAIVFYMDAPGYREELKNMTRRIAKNGYFCVLPDMYYRLGTVRFDIPRRDDPMSGVIRAAMNHLSNARVTEDSGAILAWIDAQAGARGGPVGCVGHCMSGQFITTVSARFPHRMVAAASLYGVGIVTEQPDSPHLLVDKVRGELYYAFAEVDHAVPDHVIPALKAALEKAKSKGKVEIFKGTEHGFQFSERATYSPEASEQAWANIFALWQRNLK